MNVQASTTNETAESVQEPRVPSAQTFAFVQKIAAEVSAGRVELPSFPDIALRVRNALQNEDIDHNRLAQVVAADAGLAAKILSLANSTAFSTGQSSIERLEVAVSRIGHDNVRSSAIAYAIEQLRQSPETRHIREEIKILWKQSTMVAALCNVLARHTRAADPDVAMLAGLMHNIGELYLLVRADRRSELLADPEMRHELAKQWNAGIGRAIAENWEIPESVCEAISEQDAVERDSGLRPDLTDVLIVAIAAANALREGDTESLEVANLRPLHSLKLQGNQWRQIIAASNQKIQSLMAALGS